jgi:hypothetical protein
MKKLANLVTCAVTALLIFLFGTRGPEFLDSFIDAGESFDIWLLHLITILVFFYAGIFIQLIAHEGGHLVFGLASGYRFVSFRILNMAWISQNGRIVKKRYSIAGTGGQCLMAPPPVTSALPFVIYNMGGVLMNLIVSGISWLLYSLLSVPLLKVFFLMLCVSGLLLGLTNGLPLSTNTVNNDGWNALCGLFNETARRAFDDVLAINAGISDNKRVKDIDAKHFWMPEDSQKGNSLVSVETVMLENRYMDEHRFGEAEALIRRILNDGWDIPRVYEPLLKADLVYIDILLDQNPGEPAELMNEKKTQKLLKTMATVPAVLRTRYAYEKYILSGSTDRIMEIWNRSKKNYPYLGEFDTEEELIRLLDETREKKDETGGEGESL